MALDKAILHHKKHLKAYVKNSGTFAKSVDCRCRNHGSCKWCRGNRLYSIQKKKCAIIEGINDLRKESCDYS